MSEKWIADGTRVLMGDGGFDLRNCPDPMNRADKIVRAVNALAPHEARIAELEEALREARKFVAAYYEPTITSDRELVRKIDAVLHTEGK